jgi:hypothetical protein
MCTRTYQNISPHKHPIMRNSKTGKDHQVLSEATLLYIIVGLLFFIFLISCNNVEQQEKTITSNNVIERR